MAFKRWDIVRIPYPAGEKPAREHRPALVIVAGEIFKNHGLLWVLMITSVKNRGWPGDVEVGDMMAAGLGVPSVVRTAKMMTVEGREAEVIGALLGAARRQVSEQVFANMGLTGGTGPVG
ncbi:type II toxin-antitoxin system PemK/MazF family toxin [Acidocella sp.]|uniref:type II toxin-antitoxin system PemK/MazF family toxin n=1 Tax=Acidocella sp. TaxID=50710 RepID=UPI00261ED743|nr:type II toxin-antitoxin system PemK/MazF family toxin [Acidocella sp.]MDD2795164.1 type II toxin-antitoxin system PemK/MazF family toxin [Acidocella sp.]